MPSSASSPASLANQDPATLQYGETRDRCLAGSLDVEELPVAQARAKNVAIRMPTRKSPFETCDPHGKFCPS